MFSITDSSQTIIDCLMKEANRFGVDILMNAEVKNIQYNDGRFVLQLPGSGAKEINQDAMVAHRELTADYIGVACGGYPKTNMFSWLTKLGHTIEEPVPSLFTFNMPGNSINALMGVSVENAVVKVAGSKLSSNGPLLITHWGMSGPAILKLSAWGAREFAQKNYHFNITVNWTPEYNEQSLREKWQSIRNQLSAQKISNRNPFNLPNRLWIYLLEYSNIKPEIRWADLPGKEQNKLIRNVTAQEFDVKGKTTFKEEFVTCGGIKLDEIDPNTMESKLVPHLFFAGEIMNVDGVTGGFNFQHAWTSGWLAARAIGDLVRSES